MIASRCRFTRKSRVGRHQLSAHTRKTLFERDAYSCVYCARRLRVEQLTVDHLVPLALGGIDEMTNYVSSCQPCNARKGSMPLPAFASLIRIEVASLPVHGDPIIDDERLPIEIRLVRKGVFDRIRSGELAATGRTTQQKIERTFRRTLWSTPLGEAITSEYPTLPGHVRVMIPQIEASAATAQDYIVLVELAKSATTRNLIGTSTLRGGRVREAVERVVRRSSDEALVTRARQALARAAREARRRGVLLTGNDPLRYDADDERGATQD